MHTDTRTARSPSHVDAGWWRLERAGLLQLYRTFHRHPELSGCEAGTARRLAGRLRAVGAEVTTGIGGHGVAGVLCNGEGPVVMLRAELDALPVTERTGLWYASRARGRDDEGREVGVMHACGHDLHLTALVGTARWLAAHAQRWRGTVLLVGQPAEETAAGARAMLDDGLFERFPRPARALALHVDPELATGKVAYRAGSAQASVDSVDVTVFGRGGHGAYPHRTIDPVVQASQLVLELQTIVSREVDPTQPAVITVGAIRGGTKHNVIGDRCELQLTVRSFDPATRAHIARALVRKARAVAASFDAPEPRVEFTEATRCVYHEPEIARAAATALERTLGPENVVVAPPAMGGEDFSWFAEAGVPVFQFRLGSVDGIRLARRSARGELPPPLHAPQYHPDAESALATGLRALVGIALDTLGRRR